MPHYGDQHLLRQFQVLLVEAPQDWRRELGDIDECLEKIGVRLHSEALALGEGGGFRLDLTAALVGGKHYSVGFQLLLEVVGGYENRRFPQQPMARTGVSRLHAADLKRNHGVAEQSYQPANGADKSLTAFPVPIHALR